MPKVCTPTRTAIEQRARVRANEQKRMEHAITTLEDLCRRHNLDERDLFELHLLRVRLTDAIKNQHVAEVLKRKERDRLGGHTPLIGDF